MRHHRRRAHRLRHAQVNSTTVLEWSMGYDGNFDAPGVARDESLVLSLVWTPTTRFELEVDFYPWALQEGSGGGAENGHGDTYLTAQYTIRQAPPGRPVVAVAYVVKLPTAAPDDLGSGKTDHSVIVPVSVSWSRWELDLSAGVDANGVGDSDAGVAGSGGESGSEGGGGGDGGDLDWGASGAAAVTYRCTPVVALQAEWSGQKVDADDPAGHYASLTAMWQASSLCTLDIGGQIGLDSEAPAHGIMGGFTVAVLGR
jgi:hypothetical protein